MSPMGGGRRRAIAVLLALAAALSTVRSTAEDVAVPIVLQAELAVKVAAYDKNFVPRAGDRARVLIVVRNGNDLSARTAKAFAKELGGYPTIAGLPHDDAIVAYTSAPALAAACKKQRVALVYLTPGLSAELPAIRAALDGADVLTVASLAEYVPKGVVFGFDLVSGKTTLVVNLSQAKKQHVDFKAGILKMMKVTE
jgi:hypothetical protein